MIAWRSMYVPVMHAESISIYSISKEYLIKYRVPLLRLISVLRRTNAYSEVEIDRQQCILVVNAEECG
jgi:hypothetical protein